ncbi:MAG: hypothetical protein FWE77_06515, partial [Clostridia bacterium]|nr:hypothetical protein [Clostridia bacterium]
APPPKPVRQELNRLVSSPFHLFQLYLSSMSYDARLYGDGEKVTFKQWLINMGGGNTMVRSRTSGEYDELALSITVGALTRLVYSARVTVLRVVNGRSPDAPYADYDTALLLALALAAGLADDVELYLAGPDADIMIRNADGTLTKL